MIEKKDFLFELGTEELPPLSVLPLIDALVDDIAKQLKDESFSFDRIDQFATPRRLAFIIRDLVNRQPDREIEKKGPALSVAFNESGEPTKAGEGFARSCGVDIKKLERIETADGAWLLFKALQRGKKVEDVLPAMIQAALMRLPIQRKMRWGVMSIDFIRPVHWCVMLYGDNVIVTQLFAQVTSHCTYGHRFHAPQSIPIPLASDYQEILLSKGYVEADFDKRREKILDQAENLAQQQDAKLLFSEILLDEITNIVEWPVALLCRFDETFLDVPQEALIAAMQDHQKCLPLVDKQGRMLAYFITIANIDSKDPEQVIVGNERMMRSRLSDAQFFFATDRKQTLESRLETLKQVIYQKKLGSLYDKTLRLIKISEGLANTLHLEKELVKRAAMLAKIDLMTAMVGEFPELQGVMGYYYARHDKENEEICLALKEQYLPKAAHDQLPDSAYGCVLAIADRIDRLVSNFGINQIPTGEKDPFGLRRAAIGLIRIITEKSLDIDLRKLIELACASHQKPLENPNVISDVEDFLFDRIRFWYQHQGVPVDVIYAVLALRPAQLLDFQHRIEAVKHFCTMKDAQSLSIANKRVKNILNKEKQSMLAGKIDQSLLQEQAEKKLATLLMEKEEKLKPLYKKSQYIEVLSELATLRQPIDDFFDHVMVVVEDKSMRHNRLQLLAKLQHLFLQVADISLLQVQNHDKTNHS